MARYLAWCVAVFLGTAMVVGDSWRILTPATSPSPRAGLTLTNVDGRVLLYGGRSATTPFRELWEWKSTADFTGGIWVKLNPSGPTPEASFVHAAVAYDGKLYVFHGLSASFQVVGGVWVYLPESNSWAAAPSSGQVPPGRWGHRVVVLGDRGYLLGGTLGTSQLASDVYSYHFPTGEWRQETLTEVDGGAFGAAPAAPTVFGNGMSAVRLPADRGGGPTGRALFWGGEDSSGVRGSAGIADPLGRVYQWEMSPEVGNHSRRSWQATASVGGHVFEVGGQTPGGVTNRTSAHNFKTWLNFRSWRKGAAASPGAALPFFSREGGFAPLNSPGVPGPTPTPGPGPTPTPDRLRGLYFGGRDGSNTFLSTTALYTSDYPAFDDIPDWQVPAVAQLSGAGGVFYTSQLWGYNPTSNPWQIGAVYTPRSGIGGSSRTTTFTMSPGLTHYPNVLHDLFGVSSGERAAGTLNLYGRFPLPKGSNAAAVFLSTITARGPDGTRYGQDVPVTSRDHAVPEGFSVTFPTTPDVQRNRVNVAAAALTPATVSLQLYSDSNEPLGPPRVLNLGAGGSVQFNNVFQEFAVAPQPGATVRFSVLSGLAQGYVSVLDGGLPGYTGTSDPATMPWSWDGDEQVTMFELGSIAGLNQFEGSAAIRNHSDGPATVRLEFFERGIPGALRTTQIVLPSGGTRTYVDIVGQAFNLTNKVGTVVCTSLNGTSISAAGREYAVFRDGGGQQVGTAGQLVPGLTQRDLLRPGHYYGVLNVRQTGTAAGSERTHLVVFNPGFQDATVTVRLYSADQKFEGERSWVVRSGEEVRINFIASALNPSQDGGRKVLMIRTSAPVHALAIQVNASGDPVTEKPVFVGWAP